MLSRAEAKRLRALGKRRGREESGLFLAEGIRLAEDLLASRVVLRTALIAPSLEDTERGARLAGRLRETGRCMEVSERELGDVAATDTPQGVVIAAETPRHVLADVTPRGRDRIVVLDGVQDPGNFGTIVRSADAFGAIAVVALPGTVDPWNPKSVRAAMGSSLRVPIVEAVLDELVPFLRAAGCVIFGAAADGADVTAIEPLSAPFALLLGNEGAGLRDEARAACDRVLSIPMQGNAESLNVAVAAGILLFLLSRPS
ncbi:MAG TPA: RNA methyltransferase [Longimicrobiales bacterium]|nr:RNA methyltransferase [Longimicrobiales bacterium]